MHLRNILYPCIFLFLILFAPKTSLGQIKPYNKIQAGYKILLGYNLYHWYQKPTSMLSQHRSSGQVLNILPNIGTGIWFGKPHAFIISLEGELQYTPFALDIDQYKGMGSLAIPAMLKCDLPIAKVRGIAFSLGLGGGAQFTKAELYVPAKNQSLPSPNPFFVTYVGELSGGLTLGWDSGAPFWTIHTFFRLGAAPAAAVSFNWGLRLSYHGNFTKKPPIIY